MTDDLKIKVVPISCDDVCPITKRQASATSCSCVPVATEEFEGVLYQSHEVAVATTTRVVMEVGNENMDKVTLRQWADPATGDFPYLLDTSAVTLECLEALGEPFSNEYYQQVSLKAIQANCRWSYTLVNPTTPDDEGMQVTFEFIVMPDHEPEVYE